MYPVAISWLQNGGWLQSLGFIDPAHTSATFLIGGLSGFIGNLYVGLRFENKDTIFQQTISKKNKGKQGGSDSGVPLMI
jgi:ammonia channel protein AmtB